MRWLACISSCLLALLVSGCGGGDNEDIKRWMAESSRDLRGKAPPLPELKPFPIVSYDAANLADPFSSSRVEVERQEVGGNKPDFDRPREPLESFSLETLSFIGVVTKAKSRVSYALVLANGVVYQVGVGNFIGQNFGRIVSVAENEVNLVETVQDPTGQTRNWVERRMTLQLQEGVQGKEAAK